MRVRDKIASLLMHKRGQKTLRLAGLLYEGRDGLGVPSPRRTSVGPSLMWDGVECSGLFVIEGVDAEQLPPPHVVWPEARLHERFPTILIKLIRNI